ncbi:MAG: cytochrome C oxidase subunit IV family protein [Armatimonadota bacterium]|nr:cytochrome C oxidase subunit IV family protein [Armatimonadota bacterium]
MGEGNHGAHAGGYRVYVMTWIWLLVITLLEVGVVFVPMPRWTLTLLLVVMAGMKAALIVAYFMHLRMERLSFVYAVLVPMLLGVILFFALIPDGRNVLNLR